MTAASISAMCTGIGDTPRPGAGWRMPSDPAATFLLDDPLLGSHSGRCPRGVRHPHIRFDTDRVVDAAGRVAPPAGVRRWHRLPPTGPWCTTTPSGKQTWVQNDRRHGILVATGRQPGPAATPIGYRKVGDQYAPLNAAGQQIAPQPAGPAGTTRLLHRPENRCADPEERPATPTRRPRRQEGVLRPHGAPITDSRSRQRHRATAPPDAALPTAEQQSGKAADAVRALQDELKHRFSTTEQRRGELSEASAHRARHLRRRATEARRHSAENR